MPAESGLTSTPEERQGNLQGQNPPENIVTEPEAGGQRDRECASSQQGGEHEGESSEKPDDWSLHLTPSQQSTQSQGLYLLAAGSRMGTSSQASQAGVDSEKDGTTATPAGDSVMIVEDSEAIERTATSGLDQIVHEKEMAAPRTGTEDRLQEYSDDVFDDRGARGTSDGDRASDRWDESVQSAPRQTESVDPSQLSSE